uniref:Uncharacterized protein n=1 Tax=Anguilla anguilla TaxID=7936 RepID=A0A0E9P6F3_ANGAN
MSSIVSHKMTACTQIAVGLVCLLRASMKR